MKISLRKRETNANTPYVFLVFQKDGGKNGIVA